MKEPDYKAMYYELLAAAFVHKTHTHEDVKKYLRQHVDAYYKLDRVQARLATLATEIADL